MSEYSEEEVLSQLKAYVEEAGSQSAAAKSLGISPQYLGDILKGHRGISPDIAEKLGFTKAVVFYSKE